MNRPAFYDRPLAAPGLLSYRYQTGHGFVMIGATSSADALREARRSLDCDPDPAGLEQWDSYVGAYVAIPVLGAK